MNRPRLLMHACCAPCSLPLLQRFEKEGFKVSFWWYNPNIWPWKEYMLRLEAMRLLGKERKKRFLYDTSWRMKETTDLSPGRCFSCYEDRLSRVSRTAAERGYDFFSTTLLLSPYQKHEAIKRIGEEYARKTRVGFFYEDFRPLFKQAENTGESLYRQRYCGCRTSISEAERTRKEQRLKRKNRGGGSREG